MSVKFNIIYLIYKLKIFIEGGIFILLTLTRVREKVVNSFSAAVKLLSGRARDVSMLLWTLAVVFVVKEAFV
ncbi:MAG: hypothetical protein LBB60_12155 [Desulfovibrio sp.]|nr:hypothetical protein [Desulfovibrio sp.]